MVARLAPSVHVPGWLVRYNQGNYFFGQCMRQTEVLRCCFQGLSFDQEPYVILLQRCPKCW